MPTFMYRINLHTVKIKLEINKFTILFYTWITKVIRKTWNMASIKRQCIIFSVYPRAGEIRFSGTRKSVLLKASSGKRCVLRNFVLLVTLGSTYFAPLHTNKIDYGKINVETNLGTSVSSRTTTLKWRHYEILKFLWCLHH